MFGSHLSIAGGIHNALLAAESYSMETVQVFTKNQQQWHAKPLDEPTIKEFRTHADRLGFSQIVAHDSYLINLAAPGDELWHRSIEAFAEEIRRCNHLGIAYLVTHPGAHVGSGEDAGIARVIAGLIKAIALSESTAAAHPPVTVCLETTAGQGSSLGYKFEHIAAMLDGTDKAGLKDRVAVCVDTCHILAAGYDITTAAGTRSVLEQLDATIGLARVKVWHLNDSKKALGTHVDRHEHIGRGHIGLDAFGVICTDPRTRKVPKILETPKEKAPDGKEWDAHNLHLLRGFAAGKRMRLPRFAFKNVPPKPAKSAKKMQKK